MEIIVDWELVNSFWFLVLSSTPASGSAIPLKRPPVLSSMTGRKVLLLGVKLFSFGIVLYSVMHLFSHYMAVGRDAHSDCVSVSASKCGDISQSIFKTLLSLSFYTTLFLKS